MPDYFIPHWTPIAGPRWRPGFTILELSVASAMMAVLLLTSVQMLQVISGQHRAADRRASAMQAIQAAAEEVENIPWEQLSTEAANQVKIPAPLEAHLKGGKLAIVVTEEPAPVAIKRIQIELTWDTRNGQTSAPLRLTAWAFAEQLTAPE